MYSICWAVFLLKNTLSGRSGGDGVELELLILRVCGARYFEQVAKRRKIYLYFFFGIC